MRSIKCNAKRRKIFLMNLRIAPFIANHNDDDDNNNDDVRKNEEGKK